MIRRVGCPQCRREIRLTEAELADKRGFCAVCDARFDLLPDSFIGDGPMREVPVARARLIEPGPSPSQRVRVDGEALVLRPARQSMYVPLTLAVWVALFGFWAAAAREDSPGPILFSMGHLALACWLAWQLVWQFTGWERVHSEPRHLLVERGVLGWTLERRELLSVTRVATHEETRNVFFDRPRTERLVIVSSARAAPVQVGRRIGLEPEELAWLRGALAQRLRTG